MRKKIYRAIFGQNTKTNAFIALGILLFVALGCFGGKTEPAPPEYVGLWKGADGSILTIRADGSGDYEGGSTKVTNGSVTINDGKLSLKLMGIGKTFQIDSAPSADRMTLDNINFKRNGEFTSFDETDASTPAKTVVNDKSKEDVPADAEVESLVKASIADFAEAVKQDDFTNFYSKSSEDFQDSYTIEQVKDSFVSFTSQREKILPILNKISETPARFNDENRVRTEKGNKILLTEGEFATSPQPVKFANQYVLEKGDWKLIGFKIRL